LVINANGQSPFQIFDDVSGIEFKNNGASNPAPEVINYGFSVDKYELTRGDNGLLQSELAQQQNIGAPASLNPISRDVTGVSWYPKAEEEAEFDSAQAIEISNAKELISKIATAPSGSTLLLAPGEYDINKLLSVNTVVSVKAKVPESVTLFPMRSLTFEINDGGSLKLDGLIISGEKTPDSAGNVLIRNTKLPTLQNFTLHIVNTRITDLNVNHSAHVFDAGYRSLANNIQIINSDFSNITGDILRLDKEQDDLGIYNAEYVTIRDSSFSNVQGALAKIYRGGTDESTFGPHFVLENSSLNNIGSGKRNKTGSSVFLHGVQQATLLNNTIKQSKIVTIDHTVGEPRTKIIDNTFDATPLPLVTETFTKGASTAILDGNRSL
jgi:poly(beta-D-mannuronate) lyase